ADAEHGPSSGEPTSDDLVTPDGADALDAGPEGTHPGHHQAVAVGGRVAVRGQLDLGTGALERADGGADVAEPVVEHDDAGRTRHRLPFVEGTPVSRGSSATASRNARATALNCASTRWCGS